MTASTNEKMDNEIQNNRCQDFQYFKNRLMYASQARYKIKIEKIQVDIQL